MTPQLFLITPEADDKTSDIHAFAKTLGDMLAETPVSALLLLRGDRDDASYAILTSALLPITQANGCALLLQNAPELAKSTGADGVHITTGIDDLRSAIEMLKPDLIVGASGNSSHHDAMIAAEAGADYVLFGALVGTATSKSTDDAIWWSETFEVPAVFASPATPVEELDDTGAEFIGLGETIFASENPVLALAAVKKLDN